MKTKILQLIFCLWASGAMAQNNFVYGLKVNPGITLEKIDIKTGVMTPIFYLPYKVGINNGCATLDQTKKRFMFKINPNVGADDRTFLVKCDTFALDSSMASAKYSKFGYQYNEFDKKLNYLIYDNVSKRYKVESYSYVSNTTSQSDTIANLISIPTGVGAMDKIRKIYYVEGNDASGNIWLYAVNLSSGKSSKVTVSKSLRPGSLAFNHKDGKLYGLFFKASQPNRTVLGKLDPVTGLHSEIGVIRYLTGYTTGSMTIDHEYGRYFFAGTDSAADSIRVYTLDINTGTLEYSPFIGTFKPGTSTILDLEYQYVGKLRAPLKTRYS